MASAAIKPEQFNGRRFVIYSKDEYESFIEAKNSNQIGPQVVVVSPKYTIKMPKVPKGRYSAYNSVE